ncbi:hypothetical protein [Gordonia sp. N1V]|uniref:hypothetical protein n=1 Tax=Gordonia sp. N1V TaxID=3034163 RepID=UPI0023E1A744|nr:hypothetical protein [Gordonia sp. N1V]MDF3285093.1 hypothetical protein [Gordonia sp. N1V]
MVDLRWQYWQLLDPADESLRWLAITRPKAHARIDRTKMWTLLADKAVLVANWFVAEDHQRPEAQRRWIHDSITGWDFCEAAVEAGLPTADELARIARPEAMLTVDQIDRIPLVGVVGKREAERIWVARRG